MDRPALAAGDIVDRSGLAVTRIGRTRMDLGRFLDEDSVEIAVESALRGDDPRAPRAWHDARLAMIAERLSTAARTQTGAAKVRAVLARRGENSVPTGSAAETRMVQILRRMQIVDVERQPEIVFRGRRGERLRTLYPDLLVSSVGLLIEVDGADAHASRAAVRNKSGDVEIAVRRMMRSLAESAADWASDERIVGPFRITRTPTGFEARQTR